MQPAVTLIMQLIVFWFGSRANGVGNCDRITSERQRRRRCWHPQHRLSAVFTFPARSRTINVCGGSCQSLVRIRIGEMNVRCTGHLQCRNSIRILNINNNHKIMYWHVSAVHAVPGIINNNNCKLRAATIREHDFFFCFDTQSEIKVNECERMRPIYRANIVVERKQPTERCRYDLFNQLRHSKAHTHRSHFASSHLNAILFRSRRSHRVRIAFGVPRCANNVAFFRILLVARSHTIRLCGEHARWS